MKREIKFRAFDDGKMIYPTNALSNINRFFRVIREDAILMQFTGLKDRNGKEIYEGDIVSHFTFKRYTQQSFPETRPEIDELYITKEIDPVIFNNGFFIFSSCKNDDMHIPISESGFTNIEEVKDVIFGEDRKIEFSEDEMLCDCNGNEINEEKTGIEVIGNIYENPELLKTLK